MQLAVFAQPLELDEPDRFDVDDLVFALVVDGAAVDGLGRLVDELDIQDVRVDLADTVALAIAGETMDKHGDIRLDIGTDQAQFIVFPNPKRRILRNLLGILCGELRQKRIFQISLRLFAPEPAEECIRAHQQPVRGIVEPADGLQFDKDVLLLAHDGPVGELDIACRSARGRPDADDLFCAEAVNPEALPPHRNAFSRILQGVFQNLFLREFPHRGVQYRHRIPAEFHRPDAAGLLSAAEQALLPRLEKQRRTHRTDRAGIPAPEAIGALAAGEIVVDPAAIHREAVVRRTQQRQIGSRGCGSKCVKQRQRLFKQLFR